MSTLQTLKDHASHPVEARDLDWIKSALQSAIELEHSTLPLYLAAMFSLEVQNYTTYNLIRSVVMEEMVHMAVACNTLAALGGKPSISKLNPKFPGKGLPGGAEPDLEVALARLSVLQVKNFMRLEMPTFLLPPEFQNETYPTIGVLYSNIKKAIQKNADEIRSTVRKVLSSAPDLYSNQVGDNIGFTTIQLKENHPNHTDEVDQIIDGINEIVEQGEGAHSGDLWTHTFEDEESHYARFGEIYYGARFQDPKGELKLTRETEPQFFKGHKISWPQVTNVLTIPSDGYKAILDVYQSRHGDHDDLNAIKEALDGFDVLYTGIMNDLEAMWNGPAAESWPNFGKAVGAMTEMRVKSCFYIMRYEIPKDIVADLKSLYPDEYHYMSTYTDLSAPVFFGPRFINQNA
ncbi:MAG: ferritin-like family protein [Saprospiraceae bacterium]|nr:ferritin-like family protein [Saprospiraceae bacterium]